MPQRGVFAHKFAELFVAAGNPSMRRVAMLAEARMHGATGRDRTVTASSQRISDWVAGRNVPARFDSLVPVLLTLIDGAKKQGRPHTDPLLDLQWWRRLWKETEAKKNATPIVECPYPGLAPYGRGDAALFFGRATATEEFTALVAEARDETSGITVLVGASGAGKSSLLAAGLIPALSASWQIDVRTPGSTPVDRLREAIDTYKRCGPAVLIVDQFEELFTADQGEPERTEFIQLLDQFASRPDHAVVLALRADFYARCLNYPVLAEALECQSYVLGPMRLDELAQAISRPAQVAGLKLDPGLADLVILELCGLNGTKQGYDSGALPLLSHVMAEVWQRREGKRLTAVGYRAAGGVAGSIAAAAEQAWAKLTEPERIAAQHLLLGLIAIGNGSRDSRRRVPRAQLLTNTDDAAPTALETLARSRLVTFDRTESSTDTTVYLSHEIVIDAWPRLRNWIDEDRVRHLMRQRLETDAAEWAAAGQDPSLLYQGTRLAATADVASLPDNTLATSFLAASRAAHQRAHRRSATTGVVLGILGVLVLALIVAAYGQSRQAIGQRNDAVFAGILAEADSTADTDPSLSAQLDLVAYRLRPNNPAVRARLLSTQNRPLALSLPTTDGAIYALAYSPHGVLASAHDDGRVQLWDTTASPHPLGAALAADIGFTASVAFSPDGDFLATGGEDHLIRLWDVRHPSMPRGIGLPLTGGHGAVYVVAFSPDGRLLAASDDDHTVTLWDVTAPAHPRPLGTVGTQAGPVRALAFSPDNHMLATGSDDGTTQLWDITAGPMPRPLGPPARQFDASAHAVAFTPDSRRLAVAGDDGIVNLWDLRNPTAPIRLGTPWPAQSGAIWSLAFAGPTLVTTSRDGTAKLWDIDNPADPTLIGQPLSGSKGSVFTVAIAPTGHHIATGGQDGTVRLWSLPSNGPIARINGAIRPAFDPHGRLMATAGLDGTIQVWDVGDPSTPRRVSALADANRPQRLAISPDARTVAILDENPSQLHLYDITNPTQPQQIATLPLTTRFTYNLAFSPTAGELVTGNDDRSIQLWDLADHRSPTRLGGPVQVSTDWLKDLTFSPDGHTLVTADKTDRITLWDTVNPMHLTPRAPGFRSGTVALDDITLSPDGHTLVTADDSETIRSWDTTNPDHIVPLSNPLTEHDAPVTTVDFSADGTQLALGGEDATVRLWDFSDPTHPQPTGPSLAPGSAQTWKVTFDPAGAYLAATASDNTLHLWNLNPAPAITRICTTTQGALSPTNWPRLIPTLPYHSPCGPPA